MRKNLLLILLLNIYHTSFAQTPVILGREVKININQLTQQLQTANASSEDLRPVISLPSPDGNTILFKIKDSPIMQNQAANVKTFNGESIDKSIPIRITLTPSGFSAIMHYNNGYYFIEPIDKKPDTYRLYNINEAPKGSCNISGNEPFLNEHKNGRVLSVSPFPIGTHLRTFRLAVAATNQMTAALGGQTQARDKIISIINAVNLIYEVEVAIRFSLIPETISSMSILFTSQVSDPFVINSSFASAANAQNGFNVLSTNTLLPYSNYDIGHVMNAYIDGSGPDYYVQGQAGPTPCENTSKGRAWTEFVSNAALGSIVEVFAHETGHQFMAWHTYNAIGGASNFCINGWDSRAAIEPGSGSTLMGYGGNCGTPVNYNLTPPYNSTYFHTKSIEQILVSVNTFNTCYTSTTTGNTPPTAIGGNNYTIPKGTPFTLTGSATDPNSTDVLSYAWEQYDIANNDDKGAFGSNINGIGGYPAVNSTAGAPLFRSKISNVPVRNFPDLRFVLNNANNPPDNEGEALPQVSRIINFRLTVRDNKASGGGVDSDEVTITVDGTKGPLSVTLPNGGEPWAAGSTQIITWDVNSTHLLSANVKILLSVDSGYNYPYTLLSSTANNGTASVTIPTNIVNTSQARIKIASTNSPTAEFFDVSNSNFTINSSCIAATTYICSEQPITGNSGSTVFNLGLSKATGSLFTNKSKTFSFSGASGQPGIYYTNSSKTACHNPYTITAKIVVFKVSKTGTYQLNALDSSTSAAGISIFNAPNFNCNTFLGSNTYSTGQGISWGGGTNLTLHECNTYYALVYNFNSATSFQLNFDGPGDIIDVQSDVSGFNYTYVAVNQANNQIVAVSASSNFTTLPNGNFSVYGLSYANGFDTNTLLNKTIAQIYAESTCLLFSNNNKQLTVIELPCLSNLVLTHPMNDITSGDVANLASASNGKISATNFITGIGTRATYLAKTIELNAGFKTETGSVFRAETGGCN
ncbi:reprolysin-like metallopeptidase [Emticicia soli]|uniref:Reprolysin-like metallopeptidase n=1 Tax=Emticicia soli TaxID=2027878 RepID=A0ABW5J8X5_9BACT